MAGSVNTAARRTLSANIINETARKSRRDRPLRAGLIRTNGVVSSALAATSQRIYATEYPGKIGFLSVLSAAEFAFIIPEAARDHVHRFGAIVHVDDFDFLFLIARQLFVAEKVVL